MSASRVHETGHLYLRWFCKQNVMNGRHLQKLGQILWPLFVLLQLANVIYISGVTHSDKYILGREGGKADILWWNILLTIWAPLLFILLKKKFKFSLRDHFYVWFCICSSSMCDFLFVWSGYRKQTFFFLLKWRFAFIFIFLFGIPRNNLISC